MKFALCNEVLRDLEFARQCEVAAALGYAGLEVAPFTLGGSPHLLSAQQRVALRRAAADAGIRVTGLHWLLVVPQGLSINSPEEPVRAATLDVIQRLVGLCADLGGEVLVHGSPAQRSIGPGRDRAQACGWALQAWEAAARAAERAGVTYCIEPLSSRETDYLNTVEQAVGVLDQIGSSSLRTMIDTSAAGQEERLSVPALIERWLPTGKIAHVQLNDTNRRAPGQGSDDFAAILAALRRAGYNGVASVEPFIYQPDGLATAAFAIGYLRGLLAGAS